MTLPVSEEIYGAQAPPSAARTEFDEIFRLNGADQNGQSARDGSDEKEKKSLPGPDTADEDIFRDLDDAEAAPSSAPAGPSVKKGAAPENLPFE